MPSHDHLNGSFSSAIEDPFDVCEDSYDEVLRLHLIIQ